MAYFGYMSSAGTGGIAGATAGALQTFLLREFVDNSLAKNFLSNTSSTPPFLMKELKGFGSPSALVGIIGGAVGLIVGLAATLKGKFIRDAGLAAGILGYGVTALLTGALSGAFPTPAWSAGVAADPNNPIGVPSIQRSSSNGIVRKAIAPTLEA